MLFDDDDNDNCGENLSGVTSSSAMTTVVASAVMIVVYARAMTLRVSVMRMFHNLHRRFVMMFYKLMQLY